MRPTRVLLWAVAAWVGLGLGASLWPPALPAFWATGAVLAAAAAAQGLALRRMTVPTVEREVSGSLPVDVDRTVTLRLALAMRHGHLRISVFDHHPPQAHVEGLPRTIELGPAEISAAEIDYRLRARERGDLRFGRTQLRMRSRFALWERRAFAGAEQGVRVYPNFAAVTGYALLAVDHRVQQMGVRLRRRRGQGLEFHQLREYREDDVLRQIDWKATSRRRQVISRDYQEERDQQVVFLLDCGRRMHSRDGDLSHFDQALNAILLLTFVALRQGDAVGLATFSGPERFLPPVKGAGGLNTVLNQVYDLQTTAEPSDYLEAATRIVRSVPRRALVVWITNLRGEDTDDLRTALYTMRRRHLVLLASLREKVVDEVIAEPVRGARDALRHGAAHQYVRERRRALAGLGERGVLIVDTPPTELPIRLVNRYLDVKRAGAL